MKMIRNSLKGQKENDLGEEMEQECVIDNELEKGDEMEEGIGGGDLMEIKIGEGYQCRKKDNGDRMKFRILSRAGKISSKKWGDSYNVENLESGEKKWIDLREYKEIKMLGEEEVVWLGNWENEEILEAKLKELESWKENKVYKEVEDKGQKTLSIRWIISQKRKKENKCGRLG